MIKESLTDEVAQERSLAFIRPAIRKFIIEKKPGKKIAEFQAAAMQSDLLLAPSFNVGVWPAHASSLRVRAGMHPLCYERNCLADSGFPFLPGPPFRHQTVPFRRLGSGKVRPAWTLIDR
jgi:hypothetical protein